MGNAPRSDASGPSLQERYAPRSICFGCGPANPRGLHIRSFVADEALGDDASGSASATTVVGEWQAAAHHQAFPGVVNGGIVAALLDCHGNWTAAHHLMQVRGADRPPTTVTSELAIRLLRPTPADRPVKIAARVVEAADERVTVDASIESDGRPTATARGTFVAVRPGHPAYDRW